MAEFERKWRCVLPALVMVAIMVLMQSCGGDQKALHMPELLERFQSSRLRDLSADELLTVQRRWPQQYAERLEAERTLKRARHDAEVRRLDEEFEGWRREAEQAETLAMTKRLDQIGAA